MVNLNSVPERTWVRVIQACDEQWVHRSACGRYLLRRQRVYTPGHDYQIHIRPLLGGGSMGVRNCYLRANEDNCWEITVCDDLRHGRLVTVHTYHPNALNVMLTTLDVIRYTLRAYVHMSQLQTLAGNWKNALRTMLSTKSLDDPLHGTCKHKIKIF